MYMEYTVAQIAYFSGILDGEGTISVGDKKISPSKAKGIRKSFRPYKGKIRIYRARVNFSCHVSVCNTNSRLMDWLVKTFGGFVNVSKRTKVNWSTKMSWHLPCKSICPILEACLPYLNIKSEQARLMIEIRKNIDNNKKREEYSEETYSRHLEIAKLIRFHNQNLPPCYPSAYAARNSKSIRENLPTPTSSSVPYRRNTI